MTTSNDRIRSVATFAAVLLSVSPSALFASVERNCIGGVPILETWPSVPSTGIPYSIVSYTDANGKFNAPNYPYQLCSTGAVSTWPGIQSIVAAAATWANVVAPGTATPMSRFAFSATPSLGLNLSAASGFSFVTGAADGVNSVGLYDASLVAFGGVALANTRVLINGAGRITEFDIGVNTRSTNAAAIPFFSFVENNASYGRLFATDPTQVGSPTPGLAVPFLGYADLQGVLVHEFGHAAGLGHSLVDSDVGPTGSLFPVMFPQAQITSFSGTISVRNPLVCGSFLTTPAMPALTVFGGVIGATAQALKADDRSSIAEGYPGPALTTSLSSISGTVIDGQMAPVNGAHVVAIDAASPAGTRVGTLTFAGGAFTIPGLPPGTYNIYLEPPDAPYFGVGIANLSFFAGCVTSLPPIQREYLDAAESSSEALPMSVMSVTIAAGSPATGVMLNAQKVVDILTVCDAAGLAPLPSLCPNPSGRGVILASSSLTPVLRRRSAIRSR